MTSNANRFAALGYLLIVVLGAAVLSLLAMGPGGGWNSGNPARATATGTVMVPSAGVETRSALPLDGSQFRTGAEGESASSTLDPDLPRGEAGENPGRTVAASLSPGGPPAIAALEEERGSGGAAAGIPRGQSTAAEILAARLDLSDPGTRAELVARLRALDEIKEREVLAKARSLGIPISGVRKDGSEFVLRDFEGNNPVFEQTENVNAAISTAVDRVRETAPFQVDGSGALIGLWETSLPRGTHREFGTPSRLTFGEGSYGTGEHATHVAGTLIAEGVDPALMGMALPPGSLPIPRAGIRPR